MVVSVAPSGLVKVGALSGVSMVPMGGGIDCMGLVRSFAYQDTKAAAFELVWIRALRLKGVEEVEITTLWIPESFPTINHISEDVKHGGGTGFKI